MVNCSLLIISSGSLSEGILFAYRITPLGAPLYRQIFTHPILLQKYPFRGVFIHPAGYTGCGRTAFKTRIKKLIAEGLTDREARKKVSQDAGHNRVDVTFSYVPKRNSA